MIAAVRHDETAEGSAFFMLKAIAILTGPPAAIAILQAATDGVPSALEQLPYVLAMMLFAVWMWREHRVDRKEARDANERFLAEESEKNRQLIREEKDHTLRLVNILDEKHSAGMERIAIETSRAISLMTDAVASTREMLIEQHERTRASVDSLDRRRRPT